MAKSRGLIIFLLVIFLSSKICLAQTAADYLIGVGDKFKIRLAGLTNQILDVTVDSHGQIQLPKIGEISVLGMPFGELEVLVKEYFGRGKDADKVEVSAEKLKSIMVNVTGAVQQPGTYSLNALSSVCQAIFLAGGPAKDAAFRDIKIIRRGKTVAHLDLYKFLLDGERLQDRTLRYGDTIFVPQNQPQ